MKGVERRKKLLEKKKRGKKRPGGKEEKNNTDKSKTEDEETAKVASVAGAKALAAAQGKAKVGRTYSTIEVRCSSVGLVGLKNQVTGSSGPLSV